MANHTERRALLSTAHSPTISAELRRSVELRVVVEEDPPALAVGLDNAPLGILVQASRASRKVHAEIGLQSVGHWNLLFGIRTSLFLPTQAASNGPYADSLTGMTNA